jgi:hypothetical protein
MNDIIAFDTPKKITNRGMILFFRATNNSTLTSPPTMLKTRSPIKNKPRKIEVFAFIERE